MGLHRLLSTCRASLRRSMGQLVHALLTPAVPRRPALSRQQMSQRPRLWRRAVTFASSLQIPVPEQVLLVLWLWVPVVVSLDFLPVLLWVLLVPCQLHSLHLACRSQWVQQLELVLAAPWAALLALLQVVLLDTRLTKKRRLSARVSAMHLLKQKLARSRPLTPPAICDHSSQRGSMDTQVAQLLIKSLPHRGYETL